MKTVIIGGGSYLWAPGFCRQFIESDVLQDVELVLMDQNPDALNLIATAADILRRKRGRALCIQETTDMDVALEGAQFVIVCISTGGLEAMRQDIEIPEKYGIWHTVGDTVGPGGWSRAVRNIPVFHDLAARMKDLCPNAWLINVSNPLVPLARLPTRSFGIKTVGMCPGVETQVKRLAALAGFSECRNLDHVVTGIDHGSWYTKIYADGNDVLARLKELGYCRTDGLLPTEVRTEDPLAEAAQTRAAFAIWGQLGYLPSIPDRHIVENFPWFLTQPAPKLPFHLKRTSVSERRQARERRRQIVEKFVASEDDSLLADLGHGDDPVLAVIEALSGHRSFLYTSNYMNVGQVPGFPQGAVLETRCRFDGAGIHPLCSPMPEIPKILTLPVVLRQEAIIDIALEGTFDQLVALIYTDPLSCHLLPGQCRAMVREMLNANRPWIHNPKLLEF